jgi:large subunit ribosomal protein L31
MKTGIHPEYVETLVHCACGNSFTTRSTKPNLRVDLCSKCHPFFTGDQRLVDTGGQVERFMRRLNRGRSGSAADPAVN